MKNTPQPTNRNSSSEGNKVDEEEEEVVADDVTTKDDKEGMEETKKRDSDQTSWQDLGDQSGLELRDHSGSDFLVQPGRVIHLRRLSSQCPVAQPRHATAFADIPLSTRMMTDHIPMVYETAISTICERMKAERMEKMQEVAERFRRVSTTTELVSSSQLRPVRSLSPGSEFKRSVAEGAENKTEKQKLAAAAATREDTTDIPSNKGWQVVRNFFSTLLDNDSPEEEEGTTTSEKEKKTPRTDDVYFDA